MQKSYYQKELTISTTRDNRVMNDYLQSLARLKNSQDKLSIAIKSHIEKLVPIPFSFEDIPDPKTIEDVVKTLKIK